MPAQGLADRLERVVFWLFIAGLAWCPFFFGSNRVLAWGINAVLFAGLAAAYEILLLVGGKRHPVSVRTVAWSAILFAAVVAWIFIQTATWLPKSLDHPIWPMAAEMLGKKMPGSISVNRDLTTLALLRLLTSASVFWLALQLCRDPVRANRLFTSIAVIGVIYAVYGLIQFALFPRTVLWLDNELMAGRLTSTFVNKNHYATYAAIGLLTTIGLVVRVYREGLGSGGASLRRRVADLIEITGQKAALMLGFGILMFAALLATLSRGGILAFALGLVMLIVLTFVRGGKSSAGIQLLTFILIVFLAGGFFVFGDALASRVFREGIYDSGRLDVYRLVFNSIFDSPFLGVGYGTFSDVFPLIRDRSIGLPGVWDKAHNTYLEVLQGLGLVFGSMLILCVFILVFKCVRGSIVRRLNSTVPAIAAAVGFLVGVNALVDFSLQIQAVTLTFMAILGAGVAQSESSTLVLSD